MTETPRRSTSFTRPRIIALVIVVVGAPLAWFVIDIWRVYIDEPELTYTFRQQLMELTAEQQAEGENGWTALADVIARYPAAATDAVLTLSETPDFDAEDSLLQQRADALIIDHPIMGDLRAALAMPQFVRPFGSVGSLGNEIAPLLIPARDISHTLTRAAARAILEGQWSRAAELTRLTFRFARVIQAQPLEIFQTMGAHFEINALQSVRQALRRIVVPPMVAGELIAPISDTPDRTAATARVVEQRRLLTMCELYWMHGSRGYALPLAGMIESAQEGASLGAVMSAFFNGEHRTWGAAMTARWDLASHDECAELAERWFDAFAVHAQKPYALRADAWPPLELRDELNEPRFAVLRMLLGYNEQYVDVIDELVLQRQATQLVASIEQFRAMNNRLPRTLDELVPKWISEVPIDPISGLPIGFVVVEGDKPEDRSYIIYSAGSDGVDNGGMVSDYQRFRGGIRSGAGRDILIDR